MQYLNADTTYKGIKAEQWETTDRRVLGTSQQREIPRAKDKGLEGANRWAQNTEGFGKKREREKEVWWGYYTEKRKIMSCKTHQVTIRSVILFPNTKAVIVLPHSVESYGQIRHRCAGSWNQVILYTCNFSGLYRSIHRTSCVYFHEVQQELSWHEASQIRGFPSNFDLWSTKMPISCFWSTAENFPKYNLICNKAS